MLWLNSNSAGNTERFGTRRGGCIRKRERDKEVIQATYALIDDEEIVGKITSKEHRMRVIYLLLESGFKNIAKPKYFCKVLTFMTQVV